MADDLYYVGNGASVLDFKGSQVVIGPQTVVHRDSELRAAYPDLFVPLVVHFPGPERAKPTESPALVPEATPEKRTPRTR